MLVGKSSLSWNELISDFIQCDFKVHLKLQGKSDKKADIERQLRNRRKKHRRAGLKKIVKKLEPITY